MLQPIVMRINGWVLGRKIWVYYLIPFGSIQIPDKIPVNEEFFQTAAGYMNAFLEKGEMPPQAIAPVIFNMLDDYVAGRQVAIRTGDFIAIQNFIRGQHKAE